MKLFAAFVLLIAGISALPQEVTSRSPVSDQVIEAIEDFSERIRNRGLDPLHIKREAGYFALPVPVIFNAAGFCEDIISTGLSDIVINDIDFNVARSELTFDLEMPHVHFSAGAVVGEAVIFDNKLSAEGFGRIDLRKVNAKGSVLINYAGGISARAVDIDFTLGSIVSDLKLNLQGYDLSDYLNGFLNVIVPTYLENFKTEIDELIAHYVLIYLNENVFD